MVPPTDSDGPRRKSEDDADVLRVTDQDLKKGLELETGKSYRITVSHSAQLSAILLDETGQSPLAFRNYSIRGPALTASGVTDGRGALEHLGVPEGEYELYVEGFTAKLRTRPPHKKPAPVPIRGIRS